MARRGSTEAERFEEYVRRLGAALGHADRQEPLRAYLTGLMLPGERKSVEPMAARVDPLHVRARHQSLHHFVAQAAAASRVASHRVAEGRERTHPLLALHNGRAGGARRVGAPAYRPRGAAHAS
jgi:SRSO17 transposase